MIGDISNISYAQFSAIATGELLRYRTELSYVLVVPKELVDVADWRATNARFNTDLGKAAALYFQRELESSIALGDLGDPETLRIGVAGGLTVFSLFYALPELELKRLTDNHGTSKTLLVTIDPLVAAPIPHSLYSAGAVAELAAQKLAGKANPGANLCAKNAVFEISTIRPPHEDWYAFDWLVLGIGSRESGSLKSHLNSVTDYDDKVREFAIGDISSRLFDQNGNELGFGVSNHFVNIKLEYLEGLARKSQPADKRRRRVVAIAGGQKKVAAIAALLKRQTRLFNFLITDELTARLLIREVGDSTIRLERDD